MDELPRVVAIGGPLQGREYPVDNVIFTMGRGKANSMQILWDASISRRHARILLHAGLMWLEDLRSVNGTFLLTPEGRQINLKPGEPQLLLNSSTFSLGKFACFEVLGTVESSFEAHCVIEAQVDRWIQDMQVRLAMLPSEDCSELLTKCELLEEKLQADHQVEDPLLIVARGIQNISETQAAKTAQLQISIQAPPPLPEDSPQNGDPSQLISLVNHLTAIIKTGQLRSVPEDLEAPS
ncbi:MAG: FHA domain-containing protein [Anaerolineales bacterium]|nr:FHA domain-containing protein [Anaerolineales bacterium]